MTDSSPGGVPFTAACSAGKQNGPVIVCSFTANPAPEQRGQIRRWLWSFGDGRGSTSGQALEALHFYPTTLSNTVVRVTLDATHVNGMVLRSFLDRRLPDVPGLRISARFTSQPVRGLLYEMRPFDRDQFEMCDTPAPGQPLNAASCVAVMSCDATPAGKQCGRVSFAIVPAAGRDDDGVASKIPLRVMFHNPGPHLLRYQAFSPFPPHRLIDTFEAEIIAENGAPSAGMTVGGSTGSVTCNPCQFDAPTNTGFADPSILTYDERGIASYRWDFGDATLGTGKSPSHTYSAGGTYTVALEVTDVHGMVGRTTKTVTVPNEPPAAAFDFFCRNRGLTRICTADPRKSHDDNSVVRYTWLLNGAQFDETTSPDLLTFATDAPQTHIALTVHDHEGASATASRVATTARADRLHPMSFFAVTPCRLFDSRDGGAPPIPAGVTTEGVPGIKIAAAGRCGIPSSAKAAAVTLAVVSPTTPGHLIAGASFFWPPPEITVLNFTPERSARASNVIVKLAADGRFQVHPTVLSGGSTHLIADVTGYFSEDATAVTGVRGPLNYNDLFPCRLLNTMTGPPTAAGAPLSFLVRGRCGVPSDAAAAALDVVAVAPTHEGHVNTGPTDTLWWTLGATTLNVKPAYTPIANGTLVRLGGQQSNPDVNLVYHSASTATSHFIADVFGYFAANAPLRYYPLVTPCRAADTRDLTRGDGPPGPATQIQMRGNCGIPKAARAVAVTLTSVQPAGPGHLYAVRTGDPIPEASALNFTPGEGAIGNGLIVGLGSGVRDLTVGAFIVDIGAGTASHLIVDVHGYFGVPAEIEAELVEDLQQ